MRFLGDIRTHWKRILKITGIILIILLILQLVIPLFYTTSSGITAGNNDIKIVTYNIHDAAIDDLGKKLMGIDADIIALQEVNHSPADNLTHAVQHLAEDLGLSLVSNDQKVLTMYGLVLLSRFPVIDCRWIDISYIDWTNPRAILQAVLDTPLGRLQVITTHLNTPNFYTTRAKQLRVLLDNFVVDTDTIVLGDFNTPNYILDYTYNKLSMVLEDAWVVAGHFHGSGKTYHQSIPVLRVDYIFVSKNIGVVMQSAETFTGVSDHKGISIEIG